MAGLGGPVVTRPAARRPRADLVATFRAMEAARLNTGTSGNASVRLGDGFLITPSGVPAPQLTPDTMVVVGPDGAAEGPLAPSSEWRLHRDVYAAFPEAGAVLHAHAPFATAVACRRADLPPFHYMILRLGGPTVRCADYATFGTQALSDAAVAALAGRRGCLLANHGLVVHGRDLDHALALAVELENLCEQYWRTCQLGEPVLLDAAELADAERAFGSYGASGASPA